MTIAQEKIMQNKITVAWLRKNKACEEAVKRYADLLDGGKTITACIKALDRADWLLWLLWHAGAVNIRQLVKLACVAGRLSLRHVPKGEDSPRLAYEAAERWADHPTERNVLAAARAAGASTEAAAWAYGTSAWAVAEAADAAANAAWACGASAWAVAEAAGAVAEAADTAAGAVAWAYGASAEATMACKAAEHQNMCDAIRAALKNLGFIGGRWRFAQP